MAYYHFRVATLQGQDKAAALLAKDLRTLSSALGPEQVKEVDQEANAWVQKHNRSLDYVNLNNDYVNSFPAFALAHPQKDMHAAMLLEAPDAGAMP